MQRHCGLQRQIRGKEALAAAAVQLVGVPAVSFTLELLHRPATSISTRPAHKHSGQLPLLPAETLASCTYGEAARVPEVRITRRSARNDWKCHKCHGALSLLLCPDCVADVLDLGDPATSAIAHLFTSSLPLCLHLWNPLVPSTAGPVRYRSEPPPRPPPALSQPSVTCPGSQTNKTLLFFKGGEG